MLARLLAQVHALLFPLRADESVVQATPKDALLALLDPELVPLGEGLVAATLLPFIDERVRAAIHEAKYHGNGAAFALLTSALEEYLREATNEDFDKAPYVLVPVPLGKVRERERGYNQIEEVLKRLPHDLGISIDTSLLVRVRETESQVALPRKKRLTNMRGAFHCPAEALAKAGADTIYIVVDDVLTTGATLLAACSALRAAGAEQFLAVALAH